MEARGRACLGPNTSGARLGTLLRLLLSHPEQFCLILPPPGTGITHVIGMMKALWEGQTSRHGRQHPTRPETMEEARAAVHLAVTLVQGSRAAPVARRSAT